MKKRVVITIIFLILIIFGGFWFFRQLFPLTKGVWRAEERKNLEAPETNVGWENKRFWWTSDFPGRQEICFEFETGNKVTGQIKSLPYRQTVRAMEMPFMGNLNDLIQKTSVEEIRERIFNGRPFLMAGMERHVFREGKNIFFRVASDKFLFPTVNIFGYYFPNREIPKDETQIEEMNYSNKLIGLPDGVLISRGEGVFAVSGGELALIRSPQIFEAMGYHWEDVKGMTDFETKINPVSGIKSFGLDFSHPNGTILKSEKGYLLVWEGGLWQLSEEERNRYFLFNPVIEVDEVEDEIPCTSESEKIRCCLDKLDPRLKGEKIFPFSNTLSVDTGSISDLAVNRVDWSSQVIFDRENLAKRLVSLKNYILYTSGIKK